jgi:hypothetical protein
VTGKQIGRCLEQRQVGVYGSVANDLAIKGRVLVLTKKSYYLPNICLSLFFSSSSNSLN